MAEILLERWPRLAAIPRCALLSGPTPVRRLPALSDAAGCDVFVKDDGVTAESYGGNKVRKLEWVLGAAPGGSTLLTIGATGSHHVLATAVHGAATGHQVEAVIVPQPRTDHVREVALAQVAAGARLHRTIAAAVPFRLAASFGALTVARRRPFYIPPGASSPLGTIGYVAAALELDADIRAGRCPAPTCVFVPAGTGGTAVGLAVGFAASGLHTRVVAVRTTPRIVLSRPRLQRLARATVSLLRSHSPNFPQVDRAAAERITIDAAQYGAGYGSPTIAGGEAALVAAADGLLTEPTYTDKTLASLLSVPRRGPVVYWHTLARKPP